MRADNTDKKEETFEIDIQVNDVVTITSEQLKNKQSTQVLNHIQRKLSNFIQT